MNNMQDGDALNMRVYFKEILRCLPLRPLKCLDLGSGICFGIEQMILGLRKDVTVDCVDRHPADSVRAACKCEMY